MRREKRGGRREEGRKREKEGGRKEQGERRREKGGGRSEESRAKHKHYLQSIFNDRQNCFKNKGGVFYDKVGLWTRKRCIVGLIVYQLNSSHESYLFYSVTSLEFRAKKWNLSFKQVVKTVNDVLVQLKQTTMKYCKIMSILVLRCWVVHICTYNG